MDPSALQSDNDNDVHSLEGTDTVVEQGANQPQPAPSSSAPYGPAPGPVSAPGQTPEAPKSKRSFKALIKGIWSRLNIYLLLFILVMLVAGAVVIVLTVKGRQADKDNTATTSTQNLSEDTLKQLASSETTIGSSSQILNIESNAIFNGAVLVKKDLEVAGAIKVNGALTLPGITVSGTSNFNQIQASTLNLSGAATVSGTLTAKNGLSVNGNGNFTGSVTATQISTSSLQINGNLILTHHVVGGGAIPNLAKGIALGGGGTASVSGSDTSGSITIATGSGPGAGCFATINFASDYSSTPHVVVTPIGAAAGNLDYYVNRSTSSFSVCTASAPAAGQTFGFDYIIFN